MGTAGHEGVRSVAGKTVSKLALISSDFVIARRFCRLYNVGVVIPARLKFNFASTRE